VDQNPTEAVAHGQPISMSSDQVPVGLVLYGYTVPQAIYHSPYPAERQAGRLAGGLAVMQPSAFKPSTSSFIIHFRSSSYRYSICSKSKSKKVKVGDKVTS
jgi:hypothetical protein